MLSSKLFIVVEFETASNIVEDRTDRELFDARTIISECSTFIDIFLIQNSRVEWLAAVKVKSRFDCIVEINNFQVVVAVQ